MARGEDGAVMKKEYQYIRFVQRPSIAERKTSIWDCRNIRHGDLLGIIRWDGAWRQYVFAPTTISSPIFSAGCLADIQDFIGQLMRARR